MVWRVKFQKRIGRSVAKADVTAAASRKTIRAVLRMTLPCMATLPRGTLPRGTLPCGAWIARSGLALRAAWTSPAPFGGGQTRIEPNLDAGSGEDAKLWRICTG